MLASIGFQPRHYRARSMGGGFALALDTYRRLPFDTDDVPGEFLSHWGGTGNLGGLLV